MLSVITGKTQHQESSKKWQTFDLVKWVRARWLQWLGHILRMGKERMVKQAIYVMFKKRTEGDMLMDAPKHNSWRELCTYACDKDYCRARVRGLKQPRVSVETGSHIEEATTAPFTISYWPLVAVTHLRLSPKGVHADIVCEDLLTAHQHHADTHQHGQCTSKC